MWLPQPYGGFFYDVDTTNIDNIGEAACSDLKFLFPNRTNLNAISVDFKFIVNDYEDIFNVYEVLISSEEHVKVSDNYTYTLSYLERVEIGGRITFPEPFHIFKYLGLVDDTYMNTRFNYI